MATGPHRVLFSAFVFLFVLVLVLVPLAGCGSEVATVPSGERPGATMSPEARAVVITTTTCGDASGTTGSGVLADDGLVLTAAHVVAGSTDVAVRGHLAGDDRIAASVVLLDLTRDLALLEVPSVSAPLVGLAEFVAGDEVRVIGGASMGTTGATVERRLRMDVDDVRGAGQSRRAGYELVTSIDGGDSGAGVYDHAGLLGGIVFAVPSGRSGAAFAVGAEEIRPLLESTERIDYRCDPDESLLIPA